MSLQHDHSPSPSLADQALKRTVAPAAHGHADEHGDHDHHEHEHAFKWAEMVRIVLVALAAAAVWFASGSRCRPSASSVSQDC